MKQKDHRSKLRTIAPVPIYFPVFYKATIMLILFLVLAIVIAYYVISIRQYKKTEYYLQTKNSYFLVRSDKGRYGEFVIYKKLLSLEGYKKFLFNCYLPKDHNETTELDIILLHTSGVYILESKNYRGQISGSEAEQYWLQTFTNSKGRLVGYHFFNPIMQNNVHQKWLRRFLKDRTLAFYPYVVFGPSCTLKNIRPASARRSVATQSSILSVIQKNAAEAKNRLSVSKINAIYNALYPLTQLSQAQKQAHIKNIRQKYSSPSSAPAFPNIPASEKQLCPNCGKALYLRTAGTGKWKGRKFLGCSGYPKCKYIEPLN